MRRLCGASGLYGKIAVLRVKCRAFSDVKNWKEDGYRGSKMGIAV